MGISNVTTPPACPIWECRFLHCFLPLHTITKKMYCVLFWNKICNSSKYVHPNYRFLTLNYFDLSKWTQLKLFSKKIKYTTKSQLPWRFSLKNGNLARKWSPCKLKTQWHDVLVNFAGHRTRILICGTLNIPSLLGVQLNRDSRGHFTLCTVSSWPLVYMIQMRDRLTSTHLNEFKTVIREH